MNFVKMLCIVSVVILLSLPGIAGAVSNRTYHLMMNDVSEEIGRLIEGQELSMNFLKKFREDLYVFMESKAIKDDFSIEYDEEQIPGRDIFFVDIVFPEDMELYNYLVVMETGVLEVEVFAIEYD